MRRKQRKRKEVELDRCVRCNKPLIVRGLLVLSKVYTEPTCMFCVEFERMNVIGIEGFAKYLATLFRRYC